MPKNTPSHKNTVTTKPRSDIRWDKLDNTALIFPTIVGEDMTNVFRIGVTIRDEIQPQLLQEALDLTLPKFDTFNVRMRTGVFWYYFEENGKPAPRVEQERTFPCRKIQPNRNRSYLFRVTYYRNRINLEVFHVLTDGMGAINFLRELLYQYLRLAYPALRADTEDALTPGTSMNREDSFIRNYKQARASGFSREKAYAIKLDKLPAGTMGVMHGTMPLARLKAVCREYGVSINDYLVACFIWSVYRSCPQQMPAKRAIRVAVPINLRPYFDSVTTKNFFVMISAELKAQDPDLSFEAVLEITRASLRRQMEKDHLEALFSYSVSNQKNIILRPVPLLIKSPLMRLVYNRSAVANTATVTNIGSIQIDAPYQAYVESFHAILAMSKGQGLKGTICSYGDQLTFTFSTSFMDTVVQKEFFRKITEDHIPVTLSTNNLFY